MAKDIYTAKSLFYKVSPTKARPVADLIRARNCGRALSVLENMPHKAAVGLRKVLLSAIANAHQIDATLTRETLIIHEVTVNDGPRVKRLWIRGRGRADVLVKRMSHLVMKVKRTPASGVKK